MTVIAYDGKVLAGDRQRTIYHTATPATKVFKVKAKDGRRYLVGAAGKSDDCVAFIRWMQSSGESPRPTSTDIFAICIDQERRIWILEEKGVWYRLNERRWAIGCGADYAVAAMEMGASARRAVQVASKFDTRCGLGVDVVRF